MPDDPLFGRGHNHPPEGPPRFELRCSRGISCDWTHDKRGLAVRPLRFVSYWRIYREGVMVDSFLKKANAVRMLRLLQAREGGDA